MSRELHRCSSICHRFPRLLSPPQVLDAPERLLLLMLIFLAPAQAQRHHWTALQGHRGLRQLTGRLAPPLDAPLAHLLQELLFERLEAHAKDGTH